LFSDVQVAPLTDEQLAAMHKLLTEYHRRLAKEAVLDVAQQYHSDLAQRLSDEAALIPRRTGVCYRINGPVAVRRLSPERRRSLRPRLEE
jgi:hypothetical protein